MIRYDELINVVGTEEDAVSFLEEKGLLDNRRYSINGMAMTQCCILEIDNFGVAVRELSLIHIFYVKYNRCLTDMYYE